MKFLSIDNQSSIDDKPSLLSRITIAVLVVATTLLIVYALPRKVAEKYAFGEEIINKPWANERIISDEDFPVFKSDEKLRRDSAELRKTYKCAYQKKMNIG